MMSDFTKRRLSGDIDEPEPKRMMVGTDMVPTVKTVFKKSYDSLYGNDEIPESDICLGYSLSLLLPTMLSRSDDYSLVNSSQHNYSRFMDVFKPNGEYGKHNDRELLKFYEAPFIDSHSSFVCIYAPPLKFVNPFDEVDPEDKKNVIYMWYHNPWGYDADSSTNTKLEKYLEPSIEDVKKRIIKQDSVIHQIDHNIDRVYVKNITGKLSHLVNTEPYTFRTIILSSITPTMKDKFDEIKSSSPFDGKPQNVIIDILILLKIIYKRDDIEILPSHMTMPGNGVQDQDDIDMTNVLTKKIRDEMGACNSWTFMYSRICKFMLREAYDHKGILDIVTNKLPATSLMGEHNVKFLLGKIFALNGEGNSSYKTIRKIYEVIPEMERTVTKQKKYQSLVLKEHDSALQRLFDMDEYLRRRSRIGLLKKTFNPEKDSEKIPIIMDFIRGISNGRMKKEDEIEIRSGIIFGGYITMSYWDNLLDLLLIIINCKHSMSGVRNIINNSC